MSDDSQVSNRLQLHLQRPNHDTQMFLLPVQIHRRYGRLVLKIFSSREDKVKTKNIKKTFSPASMRLFREIVTLTVTHRRKKCQEFRRLAQDHKFSKMHKFFLAHSDSNTCKHSPTCTTFSTCLLNDGKFPACPKKMH